MYPFADGYNAMLDFLKAALEQFRGAELHAVMSGFLIGLSLIVAIGAQNAFILKQGLKKHYVFLICTICAFSDSLLIILGVAGFAQVVQHYPQVVEVSKYFGALFLMIYGAQHFYSAFKHQKSLSLTEAHPDHLLKVIALCLAFTWLNPHVYLDTVVLVGSISTQYDVNKWWFAFGAVCSSWLFFFSLGYATKFLIPFFQNEKAWKILDTLIGIIMWSIAISLLLSV